MGNLLYFGRFLNCPQVKKQPLRFCLYNIFSALLNTQHGTVVVNFSPLPEFDLSQKVILAKAPPKELDLLKKAL